MTDARLFPCECGCRVSVSDETFCTGSKNVCAMCSLCLLPGGKTEDFISAAKLFYRAKRQVKVPTYLVPATQKVGLTFQCFSARQSWQNGC
jgi:hypothetical protein